MMYARTIVVMLACLVLMQWVMLIAGSEAFDQRTPLASCKLKGCHLVQGYHADDSCQCDAQCVSDNSCCNDYAEMCLAKDVSLSKSFPEESTTSAASIDETTVQRTPLASCKLKGCHPILGYHADDSCQCDAQCERDGSCCDDYTTTCFGETTENVVAAATTTTITTTTTTTAAAAATYTEGNCPKGFRGANCQSLATCTSSNLSSADGDGPCLHGSCVTAPLTCQSWCTVHANGGNDDASDGALAPYTACMANTDCSKANAGKCLQAPMQSVWFRSIAAKSLVLSCRDNLATKLGRKLFDAAFQCVFDECSEQQFSYTCNCKAGAAGLLCDWTTSTTTSTATTGTTTTGTTSTTTGTETSSTASTTTKTATSTTNTVSSTTTITTTTITTTTTGTETSSTASTTTKTATSTTNTVSSTTTATTTTTGTETSSTASTTTTTVTSTTNTVSSTTTTTTTGTETSSTASTTTTTATSITVSSTTFSLTSTTISSTTKTTTSSTISATSTSLTSSTFSTTTATSKTTTKTITGTSTTFTTSTTTTTSITSTTTTTSTTTLRVCSKGELRDADTNMCAACPRRTYQSSRQHTDVECRPHSECGGNQFVAKDATPTSNVVCQTSEACASTEWESKPRAPGATERECTPITQCVQGEYIKVVATSTTDQQCSGCSDRTQASYDGGCTTTTMTTTSLTATSETTSTTSKTDTSFTATSSTSTITDTAATTTTVTTQTGTTATVTTVSTATKPTTITVTSTSSSRTTTSYTDTSTTGTSVTVSSTTSSATSATPKTTSTTTVSSTSFTTISSTSTRTSTTASTTTTDDTVTSTTTSETSTSVTTSTSATSKMSTSTTTTSVSSSTTFTTTSAPTTSVTLTSEILATISGTTPSEATKLDSSTTSSDTTTSETSTTVSTMTGASSAEALKKSQTVFEDDDNYLAIFEMDAETNREASTLAFSKKRRVVTGIVTSIMLTFTLIVLLLVRRYRQIAAEAEANLVSPVKDARASTMMSPFQVTGHKGKRPNRYNSMASLGNKGGSGTLAFTSEVDKHNPLHDIDTTPPKAPLKFSEMMTGTSKSGSMAMFKSFSNPMANINQLQSLQSTSTPSPSSDLFRSEIMLTPLPPPKIAPTQTQSPREPAECYASTSSGPWTDASNYEISAAIACLSQQLVAASPSTADDDDRVGAGSKSTLNAASAPASQQITSFTVKYLGVVRVWGTSIDDIKAACEAAAQNPGTLSSGRCSLVVSSKTISLNPMSTLKTQHKHLLPDILASATPRIAVSNVVACETCDKYVAIVSNDGTGYDDCAGFFCSVYEVVGQRQCQKLQQLVDNMLVADYRSLGEQRALSPEFAELEQSTAVDSPLNYNCSSNRSTRRKHRRIGASPPLHNSLLSNTGNGIDADLGITFGNSPFEAAHPSVSPRGLAWSAETTSIGRASPPPTVLHPVTAAAAAAAKLKSTHMQTYVNPALFQEAVDDDGLDDSFLDLDKLLTAWHTSPAYRNRGSTSNATQFSPHQRWSALHAESVIDGVELLRDRASASPHTIAESTTDVGLGHDHRHATMTTPPPTAAAAAAAAATQRTMDVGTSTPHQFYTPSAGNWGMATQTSPQTPPMYADANNASFEQTTPQTGSSPLYQHSLAAATTGGSNISGGSRSSSRVLSRTARRPTLRLAHTPKTPKSALRHVQHRDGSPVNINEGRKSATPQEATPQTPVTPQTLRREALYRRRMQREVEQQTLTGTAQRLARRRALNADAVVDEGEFVLSASLRRNSRSSVNSSAKKPRFPFTLGDVNSRNHDGGDQSVNKLRFAGANQREYVAESPFAASPLPGFVGNGGFRA